MRVGQVDHVGAVQAKDDVGQLHNDGQRRQQLHDDVQVIVDDGRKGVHRVGKYV